MPSHHRNNDILYWARLLNFSFVNILVAQWAEQ